MTRETLIKNHFTQRIAELSSQVNIRTSFCSFLSHPPFVYVTLLSSLPILSSLFSLCTRRSFSKADAGNETASECEKIRGSGRGNSFFPHPSPFLPIFFARTRPTRFARPLAGSPRLENGKETFSMQAKSLLQ